MSPFIPPDESHSESHPSLSPTPSGHPKTTSDPRNIRLPITPDDESSSSDFQTPIRPQLFRQHPTMRRWEILLKGTWQLTKTFIVPFITIAYLSFCYMVQYRVVTFSRGLYDKLNYT
ncbi:hypothetical protein K503DRAFT_770380 [Rhizopogon vinicolor AM-OR11-026]|uniref:Uncharacterized protein n=1 Tax=Rhizopogon vinicolor AM-OR11-026 TaxID=1314800 RepID=A0A1B7N0X7_9AGAM|nr:hypothetical protein K503DRAFT_770380 [Rhizopogon vinicolor AM-OR11-026]